MEALRLYQRELRLAGGTTASGQPRYRMHWTGDPMPGFPNYKFAAPTECWALLWWVDTDSEQPDAGGGYAVLQAFYKQIGPEFVPTMPDTIGLNAQVVTMMAHEAERHRHDFGEARRRMLQRQKDAAGKAVEGKISEVLQDAVPQFLGATSFGNGNALPTVVQRKVEQIEKNLSVSNAWAKRMGRGPGTLKMEKTSEADA